MSRNQIATPDLPSLLRLCSRLNRCARLDLQTHTSCILGTFTALIMGLRTLNFIHKIHGLELPSIFADLPPIEQLTGFGPFDQ